MEVGDKEMKEKVKVGKKEWRELGGEIGGI